MYIETCNTDRAKLPITTADVLHKHDRRLAPGLLSDNLMLKQNLISDTNSQNKQPLLTPATISFQTEHKDC